MRFADIIGQEELKRHLVQGIDSGRVSHAQLFTGSAGRGALALAVIMTAGLIAGILAVTRGQARFNAANMTALAFIFAVTFNIPCVMAVASTYNETHSAKWTVRIAIYYICVALLMSFVVYHVAALFL